MKGRFNCMKKVLLFAVAVIFAFASGAIAAEKYAYVDLQKVLDQSERAKDAKKDLKVKVDRLQKELSAKQEELKKMQADLEKQSLVLSAEAKAEKEKKYQAVIRDFQRQYKDAQDEIVQKEQELKNKVLRELIQIVQKIGKEQGYMMIFERAEGSILYASETLDITSEIIKRANALAKKR